MGKRHKPRFKNGRMRWEKRENRNKLITCCMGKDRSQKIPFKPIKPDNKKTKGIIKGISIKVTLEQKQTFLNTKRNF